MIKKVELKEFMDEIDKHRKILSEHEEELWKQLEI